MPALLALLRLIDVFIDTQTFSSLKSWRTLKWNSAPGRQALVRGLADELLSLWTASVFVCLCVCERCTRLVHEAPHWLGLVVLNTLYQRILYWGHPERCILFSSVVKNDDLAPAARLAKFFEDQNNGIASCFWFVGRQSKRIWSCSRAPPTSRRLRIRCVRRCTR